MPFLIDGHNLIPHLPGINLNDPDDENKLIQILLNFAYRTRSGIEVFFDHAPAARARSVNHGMLRAVFVSRDSTADQAIKTRLSQLGKEAKNWTVVSSDREILAEAKSAQTRLLTAPEFVGLLKMEPSRKRPEGEKPEESDPKNLEVDYWLEQFSQD